MSAVRNAVMGLLVLLLLLGNSGASFTQNLLRRDLIQTWMHVKPSKTRSNVLNDDIPDSWSVQTWGGATAIYRIVTDQVFAGQRAVSIQRTNIAGGVALAQDVTVPATSRLLLSVYSKGVGGAIQVLGGGDTLGWIDIHAADTWFNYRLTFQVPSNTNTVRLLLRAGDLGVIYFDEAYLGVASDGRAETSLLANPGFEEDGSGDPLIWWPSEVAAPVKQNDLPRGIAYMNIGDMLNGNSLAIQQRARELGDNCSESPAMTGWLLARGEDFEQAGGVFAREQLYQLAIKLAPNCPQPYAALADLYARAQSCWRAAELYKQAAQLSEGIPQITGYYSFQEGLLRHRCTGELEQAAIAFQKAEQSSGWEGAVWYYGAAPFFLGQVWEALERPREAVEAYRRVVACEKCVEHRTAASDRLAILGVTH